MMDVVIDDTTFNFLQRTLRSVSLVTVTNVATYGEL